MGVTTCSCGKIFTEVVFELAAKGGAGGQTFSRVGCSCACFPGLPSGRCAWGRDAAARSCAGRWLVGAGSGAAASTDSPPQLKSCPPVCACVSPAQRHEGTSPQRVWETHMRSWVKLAAQCLADGTGLSSATYKLKSNENKLFLIGGWWKTAP